MAAVAPGRGETQGNESQDDIHDADLRMGVSADDETLIEVRAMRGEDILTFEGAANERDARVHE